MVVTSDQHLGYENSDKASFNDFLDQLSRDGEVSDFVLLGDVVDMWRRDSSGVFLENWDIIEKIMRLRDKMRIHYVAGNHDYHVLRLEGHSYPFTFVENLALTEGNFRYRFVHGYEFDHAQTKPLMEALCRVMSDEAGGFESGAWAMLTRDWSDLRYFVYALFNKNSFRNVAENLQLMPEVRLKETIGLIERDACTSVKLGEVLVFGHTHRPFVNTTETVINSGSWVTDAPIHNTYVELSDGKPRLFQFGGKEITDRVEC